ncbi:hypothetical protein [Nitrogeniibacter aestuarii]|uniref:hypothetical protein n=1 Tax=Nitrogeniibacter aestuarii TaxID=2815343 RepID=UPI001E42C8FC|nr:hypothetical protein [Nitrogeniibacter aestuarii]
MRTERLLFIIPPDFSVDDDVGACRGNTLPPFTIPCGILSMDAGDPAGVMASRTRFESLIEDDPWWRDHAQHFGLLGAKAHTGRTMPQSAA